MDPTLGVHCIPAFHRWMLRGRRLRAKPAADGRGWILRVTGRMRLLPLVLVIGPPFLILLGLDLGGMRAQTSLLVGIPALLLGVVLYIYVAASRLVISESGIDIAFALRASVFLQWEEISRVTLSNLLGEYTPSDIVFVDIRGKRHKVREFLDGLGTLRSFLQRKLAPEIWEDVADFLPELPDPESPGSEA